MDTYASFTTGDVIVPIDVTGAVALTSPISLSNGTAVEITTLTPTFEWVFYNSASDHVIEVINQSGDVIWGGFEENLTKKVVIDKLDVPNNSIDYAGPVLEYDKYYRWKIYASKDDSQEPLGWKLISSSEEAQGVFKVVAPAP